MTSPDNTVAASSGVAQIIEALERTERALWTLRAHNHLHFGHQHSTVAEAQAGWIAANAALAAARAMQEQQAGVPPDWHPITTSPRSGEFLATIVVRHAGIGEVRHMHVLCLDDEDGRIHADYQQGWDLQDYEAWTKLPPFADPSAPPVAADDVLPTGWPAGAFFTDGEGGYYDEQAQPIAAGDSVQQPAGYVTAIVEGKVLMLPRASLNTDGLVALYAAPIQQAAQPEAKQDAKPVGIPAGWSVEVVGPENAIHVTAPNGRWSGVHPASAPRDALLYEFLSALLLSASPTAPAPAGAEAQQAAKPVAAERDVLLRVIQRLNGNPYSLTKSECIAEVEAMLAASPTAPAPAGAEHAQLMKFYGVQTLAELVDKQAYHIEKLQAKLPATPSMTTQRVREG